MKTLLDYFNQIESASVKHTLFEHFGIDIESGEIESFMSTEKAKKKTKDEITFLFQASKASDEDFRKIYISRVRSLAKLPDSVSDDNEILRKGLEILMRKLSIPFTNNLDDAALLTLFGKDIGKRILSYVEPMIAAGNHLARCDGNLHEQEKNLISFFVDTLDVPVELKKQFLQKIFSNDGEKRLNDAEMAQKIAKLSKEKGSKYGENILKFCFAVALADNEHGREERVFLDTLSRALEISPTRVIKISDEIAAIQEKAKASCDMDLTSMPNMLNDYVALKAVQNVREEVLGFPGTLYKYAGIALGSYIGLWMVALRVKSIEKYRALYDLLVRIPVEVLRQEKEARNEEKLARTQNVFEKLAQETGEVLHFCEYIHFFLKNMHRTYSEVADQAWLKGVWGQISAANRKKLNAGATLLEAAVEDIGHLLTKIIQHQQTIMVAISEHMQLVTISEELQIIVKGLMEQNSDMAKLIEEAKESDLKAA